MNKLFIYLMLIISALGAASCSKSDSNPGNIIEEPGEEEKPSLKDIQILSDTLVIEPYEYPGYVNVVMKLKIKNNNPRAISIYGTYKGVKLWTKDGWQTGDKESFDANHDKQNILGNAEMELSQRISLEKSRVASATFEEHTIDANYLKAN